MSFLFLSSCSSVPDQPSAAGPNAFASTSDVTDVVQARAVFKTQLERTPHAKDVTFHTEPGEVRYVEYTDPSKNSKDAVQLVSLLPNSIIATYSPGSNVTEPAWKVSYTEYVQGHEYYWLTSNWSQSDAVAVARALKVMVLDARQDLDRSNSEKFEKFKLTCASWQKKGKQMPAEAKQHKDLAEIAFREKSPDKAMDEYIDALTLYPCWPEGQFNAASILGETGWYTGAIGRMKNYLYLVPNAPDARAAREKIAIWQNKAGS